MVEDRPRRPADEGSAGEGNHGNPHPQRLERRRRAVERKRIQRDVHLAVTTEVLGERIERDREYDPILLDPAGREPVENTIA